MRISRDNLDSSGNRTSVLWKQEIFMHCNFLKWKDIKNSNNIQITGLSLEINYSYHCAIGIHQFLRLLFENDFRWLWAASSNSQRWNFIPGALWRGGSTCRAGRIRASWLMSIPMAHLSTGPAAWLGNRTLSQISVCSKSVLEASSVPSAPPRLQSQHAERAQQGGSCQADLFLLILTQSAFAETQVGFLQGTCCWAQRCLAAVISTGVGTECKHFKASAVLTPAEPKAFHRVGPKPEGTFKQGTGIGMKATPWYIRSCFQQCLFQSQEQSANRPVPAAPWRIMHC